jgi:hypothetical protein
MMSDMVHGWRLLFNEQGILTHKECQVEKTDMPGMYWDRETLDVLISGVNFFGTPGAADNGIRKIVALEEGRDVQ